ncbi:class D beta-lactamase [Methylosinus sp. Sm6]|uniref:class D beta-lactamase n=1 Tax=Methylosinus sp. Sm6 TaxID=2866948 RepID=UPI001C9A16B9|nr:class D beta-lactamase [Methylosinus sp. Sm6]MBY6241442.1 class D beta-lactamase [Methylosinus sp. Sm6]
MAQLRSASIGGLFLVLAAPASAETVCRIVVEADSGAVLAKEGAGCERRNSPASTFKIPLALIGYEAGLLVDAHAPALPYKEGYAAWRESWKTTIDPTGWLRESVVWYSQELTKSLGAARFREAVDRLDYGNRDVSGDPGRANGLTRAWISSSLAISPAEQIAFLRGLLAYRLPFSQRAIDQTVAIMPSFPLADGWIARGKTGTGTPTGARADRQFGWFVGWADKAGDKIVFAELIEEEAKTDEPAGLRARADALAVLPRLLSARAPGAAR